MSTLKTSLLTDDQ